MEEELEEFFNWINFDKLKHYFLEPQNKAKAVTFLKNIKSLYCFKDKERYKIENFCKKFIEEKKKRQAELKIEKEFNRKNKKKVESKNKKKIKENLIQKQNKNQQENKNQEKNKKEKNNEEKNNNEKNNEEKNNKEKNMELELYGLTKNSKQLMDEIRGKLYDEINITFDLKKKYFDIGKKLHQLRSCSNEENDLVEFFDSIQKISKKFTKKKLLGYERLYLKFQHCIEELLESNLTFKFICDNEDKILEKFKKI